MKKLIVIILAVMLFLGLMACSDGNGNSGGNTPPPKDLEENPVSDFEYKAIAGGVEIAKYIGTSIRVRIPEKIEGVAVTSIGDYAFLNSGIMEVYIPNEVTNIGRGAFYSCEGLTSVNIPNSVTSIGGRVFAGCTNLTNAVYKGISYSIETERERREAERAAREAEWAAWEAEWAARVAAGEIDAIAANNTINNEGVYDPLDLPQEFYDAVNGN